jgi:hypothetical protein
MKRTIKRILINGPKGAGKTTFMNVFKEYVTKFFDWSPSSEDSIDPLYSIRDEKIIFVDTDTFFTKKDFSHLSNPETDYNQFYNQVFGKGVHETEKKNPNATMFIYFGFNPTAGDSITYTLKFMLLPPLKVVLKQYYTRQAGILSNMIDVRGSYDECEILSDTQYISHYNHMYHIATCYDYIMATDYQTILYQITQYYVYSSTNPRENTQHYPNKNRQRLSTKAGGN